MSEKSQQLQVIEASKVDLDHIHVYGANEHNLKNIDVSIPKKELVVITGISGSGKSSLAFDTIYAEGQRRYLESFAAYARQFIGGLERPDVEKITGLSPVISIEQKSTSKNPRSTVGTVTEIYDFLRLLYARASEAFSYASGKKMVRFSEDQIIENLFKFHDGKKVIFLSPIVRGRKGHYRELFEQLRKQGYLKVRVDGEIMDIRPRMQVDRYKVHDIEVVIDRLGINLKNKDRVRQSTQLALKKGEGLMLLVDYETDEVFHFSRNLMDPESGVSYDEPSPNSFSFNSPYGACPHCNGLGFTYEVNESSLVPDETKSIKDGGIAPLGSMRDNYIFKQLKKIARKYDFSLYDPINKLPENVLNIILYGEGNEEEIDIDFSDGDDRWYTLEYGGVVGMLRRCFKGTSSDGIRRWAEDFMDAVTCEHCHGYRIRLESRHFKIDGKHIGELAEMPITELAAWFEGLEDRISDRQRTIARDLLKEIRARIGFLVDVGLDYLNLNRPARSLSGGEAQRIRLATQIGSKLSGITYILDEPSIGLHQRDNRKLIQALKELRDAGNTVIVVEHDKDIMLECDYLIDLGPGAGKLGGGIVGEGTPKEVLKLQSQTADYLSGEKSIEVPSERRPGNGKELILIGASGNNLKQVSARFPLGKFICVTGVSGSGKSTLINETLYRILNKHFFRARKKPLAYQDIHGLEHIDKVIEIDQTPIGRTPRSNPATYIKVFDEIRKLFANLPEAKVRGYSPGRFSFNVKGGRCEDCGGGGMKVIEMNFLPDVLIHCPTCLGKRYNRETLEVRYKGKSISDVLDMTVNEAVDFFESIPRIYRKVKTLQDVGLGYLSLGQSSTTISGGEAQRVKLAAELSKKDTGSTFYILDEPTTGLHFEDINMLLKVLNRLVDRGNTVLVIEHNLDVIKVADHIIDIGPEGGNAGGQIVVEGTPEQVASSGIGHTSGFLKEELS